jgi:hypothetical protein
MIACCYLFSTSSSDSNQCRIFIFPKKQAKNNGSTESMS